MLRVKLTLSVETDPADPPVSVYAEAEEFAEPWMWTPAGSKASTSIGSVKENISVPRSASKTTDSNSGGKSSSMNSIAIRPGAIPDICGTMGLPALSVMKSEVKVM